MRLFLTIFMLLVSTNICLAAGSKVFTWTDDDGVTHYSDTPTAPSSSTPTELDVVPTPPASSGPIITPRAPLTTTKQQNSKTSGFSLTINTPSNDATLRENSGKVTISASVAPRSPRGMTYILELDGAQQGAAQTSSYFTLNNVDRGTHSAVIKMVAKDGKIIASSESVIFHLLRAATGR